MTISIIVPCFNEEESLPLFYAEMEKIKFQINDHFEYIFVNDGSKDRTLQILRDLNQVDKSVHYLSFSRNFGKEAALYAGLKHATGDLVTVMDADLQDPPELLLTMKFMLEKNPDLDCVGTRRTTRDGESPIRSFFANLFYKLINKISQVEMVDGARDFRLMRRQMVDAILEVSEYNRFSKGIFAWVGFKTEYLEYKNVERVAGKTSWSFWQLLNYSLEGIINFSDAPLTIAFWGGIVACLLAFFLIMIVIIRTLIFGDPTAGWPSMVSIILFLGGFQLLTIGILGKYIGKIFMETKKRPIYVVKEKSE
ncbi:glycosyltransferase family 2 protein [Streptococcus anginosus]|uniref:Glycosyltransferase, group 2 family protein n=1 Tax=Streptococcus anginosus subsp. whileyi CCUG 39159 TaxID=1095729 RepID=I0SBC7_STRAP|nr:glycosyltransferase family 2 protein [Streptococcus anginosus]AGU83145.1 putative glycosyl transferase [Streptococcus anginosus C238]EID20680.1 glycosyltransferase, group 2 family protein [Streptococcus anginosus subsp. whileyi CCUG 39159]MDB8660417.1 glycosyltransferase family 2 protein [Streptococcus anginosus]MDP1384605.1 glycosyltransferase family 2 protein [Streptococcus anginosus]QQT09424.1 glycosyltransferase family 2 protein [Streptococcus anginosus]